MLRRFSGVLVGCLLVVVSAFPARGAPPPTESVSGVGACRELSAKNEREMEAFSRAQPPTPYKYYRPDTLFTAPWGQFFDWFGGNVDLVAATFVPHVGVQVRGGELASMASWPWTIPFGPAYSCSRRIGTYDLYGHKAHRFMIEPGADAAPNVGAGFFTRYGYRLLLHPVEWVIGVGGGIGSTIEWVGHKTPLRASVSPEVVLHFGHCCDRGYFTLTARPEFFFEGRDKTLFVVSLGYTFF